MKDLEYTKTNLRLLAYLVSNATSGSQFTKLLKDAGWSPEMTYSKEWQISKKSKEDYLFDEFVKIAEMGRDYILDYVVDRVINKDQVYFKISEKEYKFPRQSFATLKERMKITTKSSKSTNLKIFTDRKLHNSINFSSKRLFIDGYYSQSIFEACKVLEKRVKKETKLSSDGKSLMSSAFNSKSPKIKFNPNKTQSDIDEQEGFMHIYMGTMQGIRNPKGHEIVTLKDPYRALDYLSLVSLLLKRIDDVTVKGKTTKKKS